MQKKKYKKTDAKHDLTHHDQICAVMSITKLFMCKPYDTLQ